MKYLSLLILALAPSTILGAEPSWVCATEIKGDLSNVVRVENVLILESESSSGFVKKAIATPRGPAIAELRVEKQSDGSYQVFPKLKFGMDRMPSASMPAQIIRDKTGQMRAEAVLKIPADQKNTALEIQLFCSSVLKP